MHRTYIYIIYIYIYIVMTLHALILQPFWRQDCCAKCLAGACAKSWPYVLATKCWGKICVCESIAFGFNRRNRYNMFFWDIVAGEKLVKQISRGLPALKERKPLPALQEWKCHSWQNLHKCTALHTDPQPAQTFRFILSLRNSRPHCGRLARA